MTWHSPKDAIPWVGLYVAVASLICTFAMAADAFQGFRQWKLWFPCRFFTINAASITLIAIAMKLPVDLTTDMPDKNYPFVKYLAIGFLFTMLANFLPPLGGMDDKELFMNIIALGILIITIIVNICIKETPIWLTYFMMEMSILIFLLLWPCWVALTVPASRRVLEHQYKELHRSTLNRQQINFSNSELINHVKKYWMMAETGNPQFVLACSSFCSASGLVCSLFAALSVYHLMRQYDDFTSSLPRVPCTESAKPYCSIATNKKTRVITLKCHHDAIEKREESIRTAAQLLGKSKTILHILEERQLSNLDLGDRDSGWEKFSTF